jgi:hypothetical protein
MKDEKEKPPIKETLNKAKYFKFQFMLTEEEPQAAEMCVRRLSGRR